MGTMDNHAIQGCLLITEGLPCICTIIATYRVTDTCKKSSTGEQLLVRGNNARVTLLTTLHSEISMRGNYSRVGCLSMIICPPSSISCSYLTSICFSDSLSNGLPMAARPHVRHRMGLVRPSSSILSNANEKHPS